MSDQPSNSKQSSSKPNDRFALQIASSNSTSCPLSRAIQKARPIKISISAFVEPEINPKHGAKRLRALSRISFVMSHLTVKGAASFNNKTR